MFAPQTDWLQDDSMGEIPENPRELFDINREQDNSDTMLCDFPCILTDDGIIQRHQEQNGWAPFGRLQNNQNEHFELENSMDDLRRYPSIAEEIVEPMEENQPDEIMEDIERLTASPELSSTNNSIQHIGEVVDYMDRAQSGLDDRQNFEREMTYNNVNIDTSEQRGAMKITGIGNNNACQQINTLQIAGKHVVLMDTRMESSDQPAISISESCELETSMDFGQQEPVTDPGFHAVPMDPPACTVDSNCSVRSSGGQEVFTDFEKHPPSFDSFPIEYFGATYNKCENVKGIGNFELDAAMKIAGYGDNNASQQPNDLHVTTAFIGSEQRRFGFQSDIFAQMNRSAIPVDPYYPAQLFGGQESVMGVGQQSNYFFMNNGFQSNHFPSFVNGPMEYSGAVMGFEQQTKPYGDSRGTGFQTYSRSHSSGITNAGFTYNQPTGSYLIHRLTVPEDCPHIRISQPQRTFYEDGHGDAHQVNVQVVSASKNLHVIPSGDEPNQQLSPFNNAYSTEKICFENNDNDMNVNPENEMVDYHPLDYSPVSGHSSVFSVASSVSVNNNSNSSPVSPAHSCESQRSPREPGTPRTRSNSVGKNSPGGSKNAKNFGPRNTRTPISRPNSAASTQGIEEQRAKNRGYSKKHSEKKKAERELANKNLEIAKKETPAQNELNEEIEKNANFAVEILQIVPNETMRKEVNNVKEAYELLKNETKKKFKEQPESEAFKKAYEKKKEAEEKFERATLNYASKEGVNGTNGSQKTRSRQKLELLDAEFQKLVEEKDLRLLKELTSLAIRYFRYVVPRYFHAYHSIPEFKKAISSRDDNLNLHNFKKFLSENQALLKYETIQ